MAEITKKGTLDMRQRTSQPIRLAIGLTTCATLALAACGGDSGGDSGGGNTEAFCDDLLAIASDGMSDEDSVALFQAAADSAPNEISSEMGQFVDLLEQLLAFDEETATDAEMTSLADSAAALDASSTKIDAFATENCPDLPADFFE